MRAMLRPGHTGVSSCCACPGCCGGCALCGFEDWTDFEVESIFDTDPDAPVRCTWYRVTQGPQVILGTEDVPRFLIVPSGQTAVGVVRLDTNTYASLADLIVAMGSDRWQLNLEVAVLYASDQVQLIAGGSGGDCPGIVAASDGTDVSITWDTGAGTSSTTLVGETADAHMLTIDLVVDGTGTDVEVRYYVDGAQVGATYNGSAYATWLAALASDGFTTSILLNTVDADVSTPMVGRLWAECEVA